MSENEKKPEYLMIIDLLPSLRLDITKYLDRHGIAVYQDFHKENRFRVKCEHDRFCSVFNELVMIKDFQRDDQLKWDFKMDKYENRLFVFENSHISNLVYCRLSNKKLYKHYMKELKKRRRSWKYNAIVIKKRGMAKSKKEEKLLRELLPVLKQSQINYTVIDHWKNLTFLRKEVLKEINTIRGRISTEDKVIEDFIDENAR